MHRSRFSLSRRQLMASAGALALSGAGWLPDMNDRASLRELGEKSGLLYGAAVQSRTLREAPRMAQAVARECSLLTPEFELKWNTLRPEPDVFNFSRADQLLRFAERHNMRMRGHVLVWYKSVRDKWLIEALNNNPPESLLADHIRTVAEHYKGKLYAWDVVNEAIKAKDGLPDRMRASPWLTAYGPGYVQRAFEYAYAADPITPLFYNETNLEYDDEETRLRRQGVLNLLDKLKRNNTPLHGFGLQMHLQVGRPYSPKSLASFIAEIAKRNLEVHITELDVSDVDIPGDRDTRDRLVADHAREVLETVMAHAPVTTLSTWGLSDAYTWMEDRYFRADGARLRPLPLDRDYNRKPLWSVLADTIEGRK